MKTTWLIFAAFVLSLYFSQGSALAGQLQASPEQKVQEFYSWYLRREDSLAWPVLDPEIYNYVCRSAVRKLRDDYSKKTLSDVDYFTKVQDFDAQDWISHIKIGKPSISKGMATVLVVFGSTDEISILVALKQERRVWKIFRVDSVKNNLESIN